MTVIRSGQWSEPAPDIETAMMRQILRFCTEELDESELVESLFKVRTYLRLWSDTFATLMRDNYREIIRELSGLEAMRCQYATDTVLQVLSEQRLESYETKLVGHDHFDDELDFWPSFLFES